MVSSRVYRNNAYYLKSPQNYRTYILIILKKVLFYKIYPLQAIIVINNVKQCFVSSHKKFKFPCQRNILIRFKYRFLKWTKYLISIFSKDKGTFIRTIFDNYFKCHQSYRVLIIKYIFWSWYWIFKYTKSCIIHVMYFIEEPTANIM